VPAPARRRLARDHARHTAAAGDRLAEAGPLCDSVIVLEHGTAAIEVPRHKGRAERVAVLGAGDVFGELHALEGRNREARLRALTPVAFYRLPRAKLLAWAKAHPAVADRIRRRFDLRVSMLEWGEHQLTTVDVDSLLRAGKEQKLARSETLWRVGDPATWVGLVVEGRVEVFDKKGKRLRAVRAGGVVGEAEVLQRTARATSARAASRSRVLQIDLGAAGEAMQRFDVVQRQLAAIADRREKSAARHARHR
jgi:CRP-like cAMP-binding protein